MLFSRKTAALCPSHQVVFRPHLHLACIICLTFATWALPALAQSPEPSNTSNTAIEVPQPKIPPDDSAGLKGMVLDPSGTGVSGAKITLQRETPSESQEAITGADGTFQLNNVPPGPFQLLISMQGFAPYSSSGIVHPGEIAVLSPITLTLATVTAEVHVGLPPIELAAEQIRAQEQQRVLGFVPNFYVSYVPDAVALTPKQKFGLAWKTTIDPISFGLNAVSAGIQQATDEYAGYGQGAEGYAKRYGASYADFAIGTFIGGAILPSVLKQDPRYFYKGTGTPRSRVMYAMAMSVICKGDNGHWQPNYSGIAGGIASGGISNLYYPPGERGASLIFENTLIGIGMTAGANILQEFVVRRLTPNLPNHSPATP